MDENNLGELKKFLSLEWVSEQRAFYIDVMDELEVRFQLNLKSIVVLDYKRKDFLLFYNRMRSTTMDVTLYFELYQLWLVLWALIGWFDYILRGMYVVQADELSNLASTAGDVKDLCYELVWFLDFYIVENFEKIIRFNTNIFSEVIYHLNLKPISLFLKNLRLRFFVRNWNAFYSDNTLMGIMNGWLIDNFEYDLTIQLILFSRYLEYVPQGLGGKYIINWGFFWDNILEYLYEGLIIFELKFFFDDIYIQQLHSRFFFWRDGRFLGFWRKFILKLLFMELDIYYNDISFKGFVYKACNELFEVVAREDAHVMDRLRRNVMDRLQKDVMDRLQKDVMDRLQEDVMDRLQEDVMDRLRRNVMDRLQKDVMDRLQKDILTDLNLIGGYDLNIDQTRMIDGYISNIYGSYN